MRLIVRMLLVLAGVFVLVVVGAYAYLSTLDVGAYRSEIARVVKYTTGRDLVIAGKISLDVFPEPKLVAEDVSVSNPAWAVRKNLMSVERLEAQFALLPLLSRTISIERIALVRPYLLLERNAKGESNWIFWGDGAASGAGSPLPVDVSNVEIRGGRVSYLRHGDPKPMVLELHELRLRSKGWLKPISVHFEGRFNRFPIRADGKTGSLAALLGNEPFAIDMKLGSGSAKATLRGGVKKPMELRGVGARVEVRMHDLGEMLGGSANRRLAAVPVHGRGRIRDEKGRYILDELEMSVGPGDLYGSVSVGKRNGRRLLTAVLGSKHMDADAFLGQPGRRPGSKKDRRLIPDWALPVQTFSAMDAEVHYSSRRLILGGVTFNRLTTDMTLTSGRLRLTPRGRLYGGLVEGYAEVDSRGKIPRVRLEVRGTQVNMGALLNAAKGRSVMSGGRGEILINVQGVGKTLRRVAGSLNGRVLTSIGSAHVQNSVVETIGTDVAMQFLRSLNSGANGNARTRMECAVIRFDVNGGIARTDRGIAAETKRVNVIGSGEVNLGSEQINVAIRAESREGVGLSADSLGAMLRIGGTLAEPAPKMDALGAFKTGASVGAAVATSGISLLVQGLINRVTADSAPCDTALGIKKPATRPASTQSSRTASDSGQPPPASRSESSGSNSLGDVLKGIGRSLNNLFGN